MSYRVKRFSWFNFGKKSEKTDLRKSEQDEYKMDLLEISKTNSVIDKLMSLVNSEKLILDSKRILQDNGGDWPEMVNGIFEPIYKYYNGDKNKVIVCNFGEEDYGIFYDRIKKSISLFNSGIIQPDRIDKSFLIKVFERNYKKPVYNEFGEIDWSEKFIDRKTSDSFDRDILNYTKNIINELRK
jgi:hypothetical protein